MSKSIHLASIAIMLTLASCRERRHSDIATEDGPIQEYSRDDMKEYIFIGKITERPFYELLVIAYVKNKTIIYPKKITYVDISYDDSYSEMRKAFSECKGSGLYATFTSKRVVRYYPNGEYPNHSIFEVKSISRTRDPNRFDICP